MLNAQHPGELCYFLTCSNFSDTAQQSVSGCRKVDSWTICNYRVCRQVGWSKPRVKLLKISKRIIGSDTLQEIQAGICREIQLLAIPVVSKKLS